MKKIKILFSIFVFLFMINSVSAIMSIGDVLEMIGWDNIFLAGTFLISFALLNFILGKAIKNRAIAGIISLVISLFITYGAHVSGFDFGGLIFDVGISEEILFIIIPIVLLAMIIYLWAKFGLGVLLVVFGGLLIFLGAAELVYERTFVIGLGIIFLLAGLYGVWRRSKKKPRHLSIAAGKWIGKKAWGARKKYPQNRRTRKQQRQQTGAPKKRPILIYIIISVLVIAALIFLGRSGGVGDLSGGLLIAIGIGILLIIIAWIVSKWMKKRKLKAPAITRSETPIQKQKLSRKQKRERRKLEREAKKEKPIITRSDDPSVYQQKQKRNLLGAPRKVWGKTKQVEGRALGGLKKGGDFVRDKHQQMITGKKQQLNSRLQELQNARNLVLQKSKQNRMYNPTYDLKVVDDEINKINKRLRKLK